MIFRFRTYRLFTLIALVLPLLFAHGNAARAWGWGIEYKRTQFVIVKLKELRGADRDLPCPEHFRPVGIERNLSLEEFGDISVQSNTPDLVTSAKTNAAIAAQKANMVAMISVKGCLFGRHFLPQHGHIVLTAGIGAGQIEKTKYAFPSPDYSSNMRLRYRAHVTSAFSSYSIRPFSKVTDGPTIGELSDPIIGRLYVDLNQKTVLLAGGRSNTDVVKLGDIRLTLLVTDPNTTPL